MQRRDGPRWLRELDDDDDDIVPGLVTKIVIATFHPKGFDENMICMQV